MAKKLTLGTRIKGENLLLCFHLPRIPDMFFHPELILKTQFNGISFRYISLKLLDNPVLI